jgi:serine/threonine protein kinase
LLLRFVETDKITVHNMQYPLISEYVKAIQDAGDNLDKLAHLTPVLDDHGEPYRSSGAFAVVFKMQDKSTGKYYALKCFTEEQEGRADAYRQIADELDMVDSSYITSVKYMEKELFVDSQCEEDEFPVLLMDWVDGETMEAYIAANYHNQSAMSMLCYRFGKMAAWLRSQSFAHGDVKPDNIIVRPDGSLTLVDYDGMFVPSMKGSQSPTIGTRDFSHPLRTVDDFDETIDDFSLASIALSLKAISMKSILLDIYGASDRLLFSENDYRNPSNSKVISALQELMCDKDFCTLYSLFMLALARKELSTCSFRLFVGEKPILPQTIEDLSTKATDEELREAFVDEWGVKYSKDGRKLLKAPQNLDRTYSIRNGTKVVCDRAFCLCSSLTEIVIPNSVASIGDSAFLGCISLTEIVIPNSVICLNGNPFIGWKGKLECLSPSFVYEDNILFNKDKSRIISFRNQKLTLYVIPNSVTSIGDSAFYDSRSLSNIVIPNSVTSIGDSAFEGCNSLGSLVIPNSVINIGKGAFKWCKSLAEVVIPNSVTNIGEFAFCGCSSLAEVVIPNSVTNIGKGTFANCSSLADVVIPDGVTSIGNNAFMSCSSLEYISIPKSVICLNGNPFFNWNGKLECLSPNFIYEDDVLFNKDKSKIISFRNQKLTSYVIPDSVTSIGDSAFYGCRLLSNIVIPNSVTSIGDSAFKGCKSLGSLVIPNSVTNIGKGAFKGCKSLVEIVIPNSVTSIGYSAFRHDNFPNDLKQELISRFGGKIFG